MFYLSKLRAMRWHGVCLNNFDMADEPTEEPKFDARLAEGVAYFEKMLQLMPEDRVTLEFLVVAYEQLGRHEDGQKALVSLAKILIKEHDVAALEGLLPRLEESDYPVAKALAFKVKTLVAPAPDLTPEAPKELTEDEVIESVSAAAVTAETKLIDELVDGKIISDEDADHLRIQVEATPTHGQVFLVSALQILEKENPTVLERCIAHLADRHVAPPVPLAAFEPPKSLVSQFPAFALRIRGAVPFATVGKDALVAVLNPADEQLRAELSAVAPCRFYLAMPSAVEAALGRMFAGSEVKR